MKEETPLNVKRAFVNFESLSSKYLLQEKDYTRQYAHLYSERLNAMRPLLTKTAENKWGPDIPFRRLYEVSVNEECVIVGTLYKHMQLKPGILKQIAAEAELLPTPFRQKYTDINDKLLLEDELQRITLIGEIQIPELVTGVVMAVLGSENEDGKFNVKDYTLAGCRDSPERGRPDDDRYVLLVSGLGVGSESYDPLSLDLLVDTVCGEAGGPDLQEGLAAKIVHVIIAGNSMSKETQNREIGSKAKYLTKKVGASSVEGVKILDDFLERLVSSVPVDVMPGQYDPSNCMLPQQPMHRCMFPKSSLYDSFHSSTNPYEANIGGNRFLGTAGQPLDDIFRFTSQTNPVDMLEFVLNASHLAPTAPDTLSCYPFYDKDPFIIDTCPHVLFAGNQEEFSYKKVQGAAPGREVLLVSVPRFCHTHTAVLVNLNTLDCESLVFETNFHGHSNGES